MATIYQALTLRPAPSVHHFISSSQHFMGQVPSQFADEETEHTAGRTDLKAHVQALVVTLLVMGVSSVLLLYNKGPQNLVA